MSDPPTLMQVTDDTTALKLRLGEQMLELAALHKQVAALQENLSKVLYAGEWAAGFNAGVKDGHAERDRLRVERDALRTAVRRVDALVGTAESMRQKQVSASALRIILTDLLHAAGDRLLACTLCGAPSGHKPGCEALGGYGV